MALSGEVKGLEERPGREALEEGELCCAGSGGSQKPEATVCCGPDSPADISTGRDVDRKHLKIEFLYLDLDVCTRCRGTDASLEDALSDAAQVLEATGVEVNLQKIHVQSEEQAHELGFVSSPTIRIDGHDIQPEVKESLCESCCQVAGSECHCRVWVFQGKEYTIPPKGIILEAILREVYGSAESRHSPPRGELPENLKRFFQETTR